MQISTVVHKQVDSETPECVVHSTFPTINQIAALHRKARFRWISEFLKDYAHSSDARKKDIN